MNGNDNINLYARLSGLKGDTKALVSSAGDAFGLDQKMMYSIGMVESNLQANAKANTSSATGLYQFTKSTWNETVKKYGAQYGVPANASRTDPAANALMAGAYIKSNADAYKGLFGKDAGPTEMYLGHFLGTTGRNNFMGALQSNPNTPVSKVLDKKQLKANKHLQGKTVGQIYQMYDDKMALYMDGRMTGTKGNDSVMEQIRNAQFQSQAMGQTKEEIVSLQANPAGTRSAFNELGLSGGDGSARPAFGGDGLSDMQQVAADAAAKDSIFNNTWETVKAELRLSKAGRQVSDIAYDSGIHDVDSSLDFVREAFEGNNGNIINPAQMTLAQMRGKEKMIEFTPKLHEAVKQAGLEEKWYPFLETAINRDEFMKKLEQALDMQKAAKTRDEANIGSGIVGGFAGALGDPLTYVGGGALKAAGAMKRVFLAGTEAAVGAVAGEAELEIATFGGVEGKYQEAAAGAFLFGGAMRFAGDTLGDALSTRLKARSESIDAGIDDISKAPAHNPENPATYIDHPSEPGSVIMGDGTIVSAVNPLNPKVQTANVEAPRANWGVKLPANLQELNMRILRDGDNEVRTIGADLMRASTGIEGGGTGKAGMTGEDIISMNEGRDFFRYNQLQKDLDEATNVGYFGFNRGSDTRMQMQREIVEAIESGDMMNLSDAQRRVIGIINENMTEKFEAATAPSVYGRADAKPVYETKRNPLTYFPQIFEEGKRNAAITRFGGTDGLQENIKMNWKNQYELDHKGVRAQFKEYFADALEAARKDTPVGRQLDADKALDDLVDDYINRKSYGIAKNGDFTHASGLEDVDIKDGLAGIANNNFTQERNLFDSAHRVPGTDGEGFAMNDLRHFDIMNTLQMYNRRMNGDIAIHGSTGKTTAELKAQIGELTDKRGARALEQTLKLMTGRSRTEQPGGAMGMLGRAATDFAFATKGGMMWSTQLTELAGYMSNRMMKVMKGGVPSFTNMLNPQAKFSKHDMASFRSAMFGTDINRVLQGSMKGYKEALIEQGSGELGASVIAGVRRGAQVYAQKSPFTRLLNKTTEVMVDMARSGVLGDIADDAVMGGVKFRPEVLRAASVTDEQYAGIKAMFKKHIKVDKDGYYKPNIQAIKNDPAANDLWRLADYVASDAVFRTNKIGMNYSEQPNALLNMALQFKAFMLKGLNGKTIKMVHEAGNGRAVDVAMQSMLSIGAGLGVYAMQQHYRAQSLPEHKREAYLTKQMEMGTLIYQGINRSSVFGAPVGGISMLGQMVTGADIFTAGRTTLDPLANAKANIKSDAKGRYQREGELGRTIASMVPGAASLASLGGVVVEGAQLPFAEYGYDSAARGKAFFELLGGIVPNDPATQAIINGMASQYGVLDTYK